MGVMRARGVRRALGGGRKIFTENSFATPLCYYREETGLENGGSDTPDTDYFDAISSFVIGGLRIGWNKLNVSVIVRAPIGTPPLLDAAGVSTAGVVALLREAGHGIECEAPGVSIPWHALDDGYYPSPYTGIDPRRDATAYQLNNVLVPTNWVLEQVISYGKAGGSFTYQNIVPGEYKMLFLSSFPTGSVVTLGVQTTE